MKIIFMLHHLDPGLYSLLNQKPKPKTFYFSFVADEKDSRFGLVSGSVNVQSTFVFLPYQLRKL